MKYLPRQFFLYFFTLTALTLLIAPRNTLWAQFSESTKKENGSLVQGIEQYQQGHFQLAEASLEAFLHQTKNPVTKHAPKVTDANIAKAHYYFVLSQIKNKNRKGILDAGKQLSSFLNSDYKSHIAFCLGQYYFREGDLQNAIRYYEQADIAYLNNDEIADKKFELAYCYFNKQQFEKAKPLFAAIKDLPKNKYYVPGNYYYGLLAYNDKNYSQALKSFKRIDQEPTYKDVVPYYEAEVYYFTGDHNNVLDISEKYLRKDSLYYTQDMQLLTAQTLFEQKKYEEALPYFERYYKQSDKIRKEELYELAYTYYRLKNWQQAIKCFQPLSNAKDSLGQTSMYLLGDCYLKINDKKGARNAFEICSNMNFNASQTEAASFLYAKLSDELGYESTATKQFNNFINQHPNSNFIPEAKTLLSQLLAKSSNYAEAFNIMSNLPGKDMNSWALFQKVAVGRALQVMQNNQLSTADSIFNLSLQQPVNPAYEALAYFWKGEIAYRLGNYPQSISYCNSFLNKSSGISNEVSAISSKASRQNAQMIIGYAQMKSGDYSNAQQAFSQAQKNTTSNPEAAAAATLHEADAYFMQQNFVQAEKFYKDAIAKGVANSDYARYQLALIAGLKGDNATKRQLLQNLIDKQPASAYQSEARYELALTNLNDGRTKEAIEGLEHNLNDQATSEKVKAKSLLKLAYAYQLDGNNDQAIESFENFLTKYPGDTARGLALDALRSVYVADGTPEKYIVFLKEHNLPSPDEATLENTFYDAAIQDFSKENWNDAASGFGKYLNQFPKGKNAVKAHFYRGIALEKNNQSPKALEEYDSVLKAGWSDFAEEAASNAARIAFTNSNYDLAVHYYSDLKNVTSDNQMLQTAYEGLMKSSFELKDYEKVVAYSDTLVSLPGLPKDELSQANLFKARSLQKTNYPEEALAIYKQLDKDNLGAISAEARYRIAEISYDKGDYKAAEKEAGYAVQSSSGQDYWIVKCYLLLGDILAQEKDYFNAKATLSSIINNTKIESLKQEASEKLAKVKLLESQTSKLKEN